MNETWKQRLRPWIFSPATEPVRDAVGRTISLLCFRNTVRASLENRFRQLPPEFRDELLPELDWIMEGVIRGRGLTPKHQLRLFHELSSEATTEGLPRPTLSDAPTGRPLRLLFVTGCFPSTRNGGGLRFFDLIRLLARRHRVSLYTALAPDEIPEGKEMLLQDLECARIVEGKELDRNDFRGWLEEKARKENFDAIHFAWEGTTPLLAAAAGFARRRFYEMVECTTRKRVLDLRRLIDQRDARKIGQATYHLCESWTAESLAAKTVDSLVAVTPADAEFAATTFRCAMPVVLPTCVSDSEIWERLTPEASPAKLSPSGVFLGFYGHPPNLEALVWYLDEVHPRIVAAIPDYKFRIVGVGDLGALGERLRLPSVEVVGPVDDLVPAIRSAKVTLSPLVSGAGIRGKINQYSACGRPSVSTSIGVCGTPYEDGKSVLIADTASDFAAAVVKLLRDPGLYETVREAAFQIAQTGFRWEAHLPELERLYAR